MKTVSYSGRVKDLLHSGNILVRGARNNKFPICDCGLRTRRRPGAPGSKGGLNGERQKHCLHGEIPPLVPARRDSVGMTNSGGPAARTRMG